MINAVFTPSTDNKISYLSGNMGVTEKIKRAMYDVAKQFVYIGFLLWEVKNYEYYKEGGYKDVYEYAAQELGFKKSSTKNFIAISEKFGIKYENKGRGVMPLRTMSLQQEYEKFNYSQLCEMLSMSDKQITQATPDMTVRQLRELKKQPEPTIDFKTLDKIINKSGQTSGPKEPTIEEIEKENERLSNLYCTEANIVIINGKTTQVTHYLMQELCRLAEIKYIDYEDYEITIKMKP